MTKRKEETLLLQPLKKNDSLIFKQEWLNEIVQTYTSDGPGKLAMELLELCAKFVLKLKSKESFPLEKSGQSGNLTT